jgi:hypothetical protein
VYLARIPHRLREVVGRGGNTYAVGCLRSALRLSWVLVYPRKAGILNVDNGVGIVLAGKLRGRDGRDAINGSRGCKHKGTYSHHQKKKSLHIRLVFNHQI